jgi:hypothetical protein
MLVQTDSDLNQNLEPRMAATGRGNGLKDRQAALPSGGAERPHFFVAATPIDGMITWYARIRSS